MVVKEGSGWEDFLLHSVVDMGCRWATRGKYCDRAIT